MVPKPAPRRRANGFALDKPAAFGGLGPRRFGKPARAKARFVATLVPLLEQAWRERPLEQLSALRALAFDLERFGKVVPAAFREDVEARVRAAEENEDEEEERAAEEKEAEED